MGVVSYLNIKSEIVSETRSGVESDYVPDSLGSTVALLVAGQTITDQYTYWPYGTELTHTGSSTSPMQFVGTAGYRLDGGDRYYVRARHLLSDLGRWMTVDPVWPIELAYAYVSGCVTTEADPSGLSTWFCRRPVFPICGSGPNHGWDHWYVDIGGQPGCGSVGLGNDGNIHLDDPVMNAGTGGDLVCMNLGLSKAQDSCLCHFSKLTTHIPPSGPCKTFNSTICKYTFWDHNCQEALMCLFKTCGVKLPKGNKKFPGF